MADRKPAIIVAVGNQKHGNFKWRLIDEATQEIIHTVIGWSESDMSVDKADEIMNDLARRQGYRIVESFGVRID